MNHRAARRAFALASQFRASKLSPRISAVFWVTETAETDFRVFYSRLLTWANAVDEGLNPPRSFNLVSPARNQPSGDPNCELFSQGPIIPVSPSTPPYRLVGAYGNN